MTRDLDLSTHEARMLALTSLAAAPDESRERYTRYILAVASRAARKAMEELMELIIPNAFIDAYIAKGVEQGVEQGKAIEGARMLLRYLEARFDVPGKIRDRITTCSDLDRLYAWFDRAIPAQTLDEVFTD
jgi:hypothetical protein